MQAGTTFKTARKGTLWLRAETPGRESGPLALRPGADYVTLDVLDFALAGARKWTSRFHPVIVSDLSVSSLQTRVRASALIDPRELVGGISSTNAAMKGEGVRTLCQQVPWNDTFRGEINVLSLRSEKLLKTVLGTYASLQGSLQDAFGGEAGGEVQAGGEGAGDGYESVTAVIAAKVAGTILKKVGVAAAVEAAKIITAEDGTYKTRLSKALDAGDLGPGYYVLMEGGGRVPGTVQVDLSQSPPLVLVDGKPLRGKDFALVRVRASSRHEDIASVPGVGEAWATLRSVVSSGGDPRAAFGAFVGALTMSPDLIDSDKHELKAMVDNLLAPLTSASREPGFESALVGVLPQVRRAMSSLAKAWSEGKFDVPAAQPAVPGTSATPPRDSASPPAPAVTLPGVQPPPSDVAQRAETANQRFETALAFCFKWEGDYSDDPVDRGGATKYGITHGVYSAWLRATGQADRPVKELTKDEARQIYWANYWRAVRCDAFKRQMDLVMFDAAVNHGTEGATRILQRTLNALRAARGDGAGENLMPDGAIGPRTMAEVARNPDTRAMCKEYLEQRRQAYQRIVKANASQERFIKGWMNRVRDLEIAISEGGEHSDYETVGRPERLSGENTPFAGYVD